MRRALGYRREARSHAAAAAAVAAGTADCAVGVLGGPPGTSLDFVGLATQTARARRAARISPATSGSRRSAGASARSECRDEVERLGYRTSRAADRGPRAFPGRNVRRAV